MAIGVEEWAGEGAGRVDLLWVVGRLGLAWAGLGWSGLGPGADWGPDRAAWPAEWRRECGAWVSISRASVACGVRRGREG